VVALVLALLFVGWQIGRGVVRPLEAMSRAARRIAQGHLDFALPGSPVTEVAEVRAAFEAMRAGLKESIEQQAALEEERRLFIGAVAHDLRTPLFTLRAHLRGLQKGIAATPEKVREYVDECVARADALERLVADLFAFTRLEYLEQEPEHAPLELGALLRQAVEGVRPLAEARGIALALDGPAEPCPLLGDGHLLVRVVENVLDNALRHTPEGGRIRVRWSRADATLVFAVEDSGPGIAAPDLPHLFTPLYRGEASRNRQTGGAGLGLAIARRILRAHGGDLTAANGPRGGAVFTGTLPGAVRPQPVGTASHA
jgi:signal transduction histidine kinase